MKTKGMVEEDMKKLHYPRCVIFRPGLLMNRDNPRFIEKVLTKFGFGFSKIESADLGKAMLEHAIRYS